MSVGKKATESPQRQQEGGGEEGGAVRKKEATARHGRCFSGLELSIGPGPLRDVDAGRLKGQIRRWAKAVVAYARQLSFGSPRRPRSRSSSTRAMRQGGGATERSATFPRKSAGPGGAENELEPAP